MLFNVPTTLCWTDQKVIVKLTLLNNYNNYINIFLEKDIAILSEFIYITYTIPIKESKKVLYKLIYPLIINKLRVLYEYFNTNIVKN